MLQMMLKSERALLRERGALFHGDLVGASGRLPIEVEQGLWDLVARGFVTADSFQAVRALLAREGDVNAPEGDGATALHWAVERDDVDIVEALLHAGADPNTANDYGIVPLYLACTNRNATVVEKLLVGGADPNAATSMGETALMTCARTGSADAVAALLDHGASNVNATESSHGQTALMWAATLEDPDVVRVLLEHGADVGARSTSHLLPVSLGTGDAFGAPFMQPQRGSSPLLFAARHGRITALA